MYLLMSYSLWIIIRHHVIFMAMSIVHLTNVTICLYLFLMNLFIAIFISILICNHFSNHMFICISIHMNLAMNCVSVLISLVKYKYYRSVYVQPLVLCDITNSTAYIHEFFILITLAMIHDLIVNP